MTPTAEATEQYTAGDLIDAMQLLESLMSLRGWSFEYDDVKERLLEYDSEMANSFIKDVRLLSDAVHGASCVCERLAS